MRILLLSANTGGGHNSAAAAVKAAFEQKDVECVLKDTLAFISEIHSDIISTGHSYIYRHLPQLFGAGYRFEEKHTPKFIYEQMSWGAKSLASYLREESFDAIISTHIFGSMMVTEARKTYGVTLPHYVVVTDYAVHPGTDMVDVKRYFIASEEMAEAYRNAGVEEERLCPSGIPIHPNFLCKRTKQEARMKLHLPTAGKVVLLFSGSIGCGNLNRIAPELEKQLPEHCTLVIICGHNARLYRQLKEVVSPQTVIVGYTTRIADYMAASDLCISKPGGLSTTEMLVSQLPAVLMLSVPGCETRNLEFFTERSAAVGTDEWDEALRMTGFLLRNPDKLVEIKENLKKIDYPGGTSVIVNTVLSDIGCSSLFME